MPSLPDSRPPNHRKTVTGRVVHVPHLPDSVHRTGIRNWPHYFTRGEIALKKHGANVSTSSTNERTIGNERLRLTLMQTRPARNSWKIHTHTCAHEKAKTRPERHQLFLHIPSVSGLFVWLAATERTSKRRKIWSNILKGRNSILTARVVLRHPQLLRTNPRN